MFIFCILVMKQLGSVILGFMWIVVLSVAFNVSCVNAWWFDNKWPMWVLEELVNEANKDEDQDKVQDTKLGNVITSKWNTCGVNSSYTFSNTLCVIKKNLYSYLQYAVYIWLAVATILLIWNGLQMVVSKDNEAQFKEFQKNAINIVKWVVLLLAFYFIIDLFVSVVNLLTK